MLATRLSGPAAEPLLLTDAKTYLRVSGTEDDILIGTLIRAARETIERETGLGLIDQTWRLVLDAWPPAWLIAVPLRPFKSLDAVRVLDANAAPSVVALSTFDVSVAAGTIRLKSRPADPLRLSAGIELDITIGFGTAGSAIPNALVQAIQQLVAFWYENRGDAGPPVAPPESVLRVLAPFRKRRLAP
jgi:uncharacterized phiE125 gp8 family phage protein